MLIIYLIASFIVGLVIGFRLNQCLNDSIASALNELDLDENKTS